ncbi:hypothetical protein [Streptomyces sp. NPDC058268]|uniref:hypothetical protein n=1 Tax=Streptomyces sp. NPDC058268 TaxID=3346413 RepID=UPI0036EA1CEF
MKERRIVPEQSTTSELNTHLSALDALCIPMDEELRPQGWQVISYIGQVDAICPRGTRFSVTRHVEDWQVKASDRPAVLVVSVAAAAGTDAAPRVIAALRFLSYQHGLSTAPAPRR